MKKTLLQFLAGLGVMLLSFSMANASPPLQQNGLYSPLITSGVTEVGSTLPVAVSSIQENKRLVEESGTVTADSATPFVGVERKSAFSGPILPVTVAVDASVLTLVPAVDNETFDTASLTAPMANPEVGWQPLNGVAVATIPVETVTVVPMASFDVGWRPVMLA